MKRSLVAATAVTLLLAGCATGETGHLDPEIDADLGGPLSQPVRVTSSDVGNGNADEAAEEEGLEEDEGVDLVEGEGEGENDEDQEGDAEGAGAGEGAGAEGESEDDAETETTG